MPRIHMTHLLCLAALTVTQPAWADDDPPLDDQDDPSSHSARLRDPQPPTHPPLCPALCVGLSYTGGLLRWHVTAKDLSQGAKVTVEIKDLGASRTLETQSELEVSGDRGLRVDGAEEYGEAPDLPGYITLLPVHPLECGHSYQAIVYDPIADNSYYSQPYTPC